MAAVIPVPAAWLDLSGSTLLVLAAVGVAALVLGAAWGRVPVPSGADFEVRHRPDRRSTTVRGRVPASKVGTIRSFFERDLCPSGPVTVRGTFGPPSGRALRLEISGPLDAGQKQRVRNFLVAVLGR